MKDNIVKFPSKTFRHKTPLPEVPICPCGERLIETDSGYACPVHGYLDEPIQKLVDAPLEGAGEAW